MSPGFVLFQYSDPKNTSKFFQRYIKNEEKQLDLQLISWFSQSADLNPIELVWHEHDRKDKAKQHTSATHFWQLLQESWAELPSVYLQLLVERIPRICEAVMAAKGGHFEESKV